MLTGNDVYQREVAGNLPRLLALFDRDETGESYGCGDRYHWAWSLIDFGNGTFQGAAHGLARLLVHGLLPAGFSEAAMRRRILAIFRGAERLRRGDGSLEEAFPYEGSFCVTALVAYDLLSAVELLGDRLAPAERDQCLAVVRPLIAFLLRVDETHAFISNHLATAAAALVKWSVLTGEDGEERGQALLARILARQSAEGWFDEYGGADPGYQTLCLYYLADLHRLRPSPELLDRLCRSLRFLWHFAHPDGSFGGLYGSRNTRFYYPAGVEYLAAFCPEAAALARFMRGAIARRTVVTLAALDEPNLVPMFNSCCWALVLAGELPAGPLLPCLGEPCRRHWPAAGLLVERGANHYSIISTHKGGVVYHFVGGERRLVEPGLVFRDRRGHWYSTQRQDAGNSLELADDRLTVSAALRPMTKQCPGPWQFIVLRLLNVTVMRQPWLREKVKQLLVRLLITGAGRARGSNRREIFLGEELRVIDTASANPGLLPYPLTGEFSAIHMASQGYWQIQDEAE